MTVKPKVNSEGEKELDKLQKQFEAHEEQIQSLTMDRMNQAPLKETEEQTKLSSQELANNTTYLKPKRSISSKEKFNEEFRKSWEYDKQYVKFVAENKEIIGESIDLWSKPYPGVPCENWVIPVNKPVWGPRYLAQQISRCKYHRLKMEDSVTSNYGFAQQYGTIVVDHALERLSANPVKEDTKVFMGAKTF